MLLRFSVENFMSFKNQTEFKMAASKIMRHDNHVYSKDGKRILKGSFIFGANASGKTNFIKAMAFARNIVFKGLARVNCEKKYFRVDSSYKNKPGIFQFDILSNNRFYSYGFVVSYLNSKIEEEWLYQIGDTEKCIFLRTNAENGEVDFKTDLIFSDEIQKNRFSVYSQDILAPKMNQTLFLSDVISRSPDNSIDYQAFCDVFDWFKCLMIISPASKFKDIGQIINDENSRCEFARLLEYFDTGIKSIKSETRDFDKMFAKLPEDLRETLKSDIISNLSDSTKKARLTSGTSMVEVHYKNGDLVADEIVTNHGNDSDLFEFNDESDGTKRLFDLIPIYEKSLNSHVIVIDELDRSFHTKLTIEFIKFFYNHSLGHPSQLIATTHDSNIIDLDFIRQDEIWFVERSVYNDSSLYSLNKFKPRFDKKAEKDYLLGRYGAIPIFNYLALVESDEEETENVNDCK